MLLLLLIPAAVAIAIIDLQLRTAITPHGIISFEFCGFTASCYQALVAWGATGREFAMLSIGVDFLFMSLYGSSLAVALWLSAKRLGPTWQRRVAMLGWLALLLVALPTALLLPIFNIAER